MKKLLFFLLIILISIQQIVVLPGCATIIPPEGGPRDSLPPALRRADPADSSLSFSDNKITLVFDEYVNADNYQQEMIVSPIPTNTPTVTRKLNVVTVKLRDTLQPNTTYSINFGNTIKDVNESNVLKNFTYIFSTGSYFDSLELAGNVVLAETGEIDTTLTVMLHSTNIDSALIKEKPRYITRLDNRGNFRFKNLPPDTFYVYALKDEGGSYRYLNPTQLFAFSDSAVITGGSAKPVTLYAYAGKEAEKTKSSAAGAGSKKAAEKRLKFSTNLAGPDQDLLEKFIFTFEIPLKTFDSTKIHFTRDSTYTPITNYNWEKDSTMKVVKLNYTWTENVSHHLILEKDFATDTLGQQLLKADTIDFKTKQNRDYGKLTLRFRNLDLSKNPVLLFVQNNIIKKSFPLTSTTFSQSLFAPGEYSLRILNDDNKNGVWDGGKFFGERKQPELVKPISRTINVRPGLDNSFDINVTAPPAEPRSPQSTNPNPNTGRPNSNRPNVTRPNQRF